MNIKKICLHFSSIASRFRNMKSAGFIEKLNVNLRLHNCFTHRVECGITQGSNSGPLLFILHINDLFNVSKLMFIIEDASAMRGGGGGGVKIILKRKIEYLYSNIMHYFSYDFMYRLCYIVDNMV